VVRAGSGIYVAPIDVLIPSYGSLLDGSGKYINQLLVPLSPTDPRVAALWQIGMLFRMGSASPDVAYR